MGVVVWVVGIERGVCVVCGRGRRHLGMEFDELTGRKDEGVMMEVTQGTYIRGIRTKYGVL